jgi:DNA-binding transcriptional LysR family regulator
MLLFSRSGVSLERLRTFWLVADAGSIAAAAGRNAVRQSQFSRQIKELEEHFEVELVRRVGKTLVLTEAGEALARVAREQLGALEDYERSCRKMPIEFTIGAGDTLVRWLLIPRLVPRRRVVIRTLDPRDVAAGVRDLSLDFGLVHDRGARLGRVRYRLVVPRGLLERRDPQWVVDHVPLAIPLGDVDWTTALARLAEPALSCDTFPQAACAVETGRYAAILPDVAKVAGDVAVIDWPALHVLDRTIHLAWNERAMRVRPNAEAMRDWLKDKLRF